MFQTTYSSNKGNAICCRSEVPDSGYCSGNDGKHICSMPSHDKDPESKYKDVLSEGNKNYQMFAFCPMLNSGGKNVCGVPASDNTDYRLFANLESQTVSVDSLRFRRGNSEVRAYDFCHYEIIADRYAVDLERLKRNATGGLVEIHMMITKMKNMNVHVYGGKDRFSATTPLVEGNVQPEPFKKYTFSADEGILMIALPEYKKETEFEFHYWVEPL